MGEYDKAESDIKKALELNFDNINAIMSMAEFYSMTTKPEDACKWLKKAKDKGYNDWNYIKTYKTFDNIRTSPCYLKIMQEKWNTIRDKNVANNMAPS
jgi:tetratricopeptide (TPR) repeat protein